MSSSSASGDRSNTRRFISKPTTASARHAARLAGTWTSTIGSARTPALTGEPLTRPTSIIPRSRQRHELRNAFGAQFRSGYTLPALYAKGASHQGANPGRNPLISGAKLFRQPEPALIVMLPVALLRCGLRLCGARQQAHAV